MGPKSIPMPATRKAVSYKRLQELEIQLRAEVEELFALSEQGEQPEVLDGLGVSKEIARRQDRLVRLMEAKTVLEARAKVRLAAEQAEYEAKLEQRKERERTTGRREGWPPTNRTSARSALRRSVQLHRPTIAHYEKLDACGF